MSVRDIHFFWTVKKITNTIQKYNRKSFCFLFILQSIRIMYKHSNLESFSRCYLQSHNKRFRGLGSFLFHLFFYRWYTNTDKSVFSPSHFYVTTQKSVHYTSTIPSDAADNNNNNVIHCYMEKRAYVYRHVYYFFMEYSTH